MQLIHSFFSFVHAALFLSASVNLMWPISLLLNIQLFQELMEMTLGGRMMLRWEPALHKRCLPHSRINCILRIEYQVNYRTRLRLCSLLYHIQLAVISPTINYCNKWLTITMCSLMSTLVCCPLPRAPWHGSVGCAWLPLYGMHSRN